MDPYFTWPKSQFLDEDLRSATVVKGQRRMDKAGKFHHSSFAEQR